MVSDPPTPFLFFAVCAFREPAKRYREEEEGLGMEVPVREREAFGLFRIAAR
jgi:hypothetical protein